MARFVAMVTHGERAAWTVEAKDIDDARALVEHRLSKLPQPYRDASMICTELRAVEEQLGKTDPIDCEDCGGYEAHEPNCNAGHVPPEDTNYDANDGTEGGG